MAHGRSCSYVDPVVKASRRHSSRDYTDTTMSRRSASCSEPSQTPIYLKVQRWEGQTRTLSDWDGLRKDPELWFENGDCLVHLYARGQSRRGPSFCVPFNTLTQYQCGSMFSLCFARITATSGGSVHKAHQISITATTMISGSEQVELYIPAPENASRKEAFEWHLTTRNFFAYVFGKPLVGVKMGQTLVDLQERMHLFRSRHVNNQRDFLSFIDSQGYRAFVDCPDYALSMLYYAEHYKLRDVWIDAFAHCVGMNESIAASSEFAPLSSLTKALITRACLEMHIELDRVTAAARNFLEEDLSPAYLGLSDGARVHLDRFRYFLYDFYAEKFGYWPPPKGVCFPKSMFQSLYNDFNNLYAYLVDSQSTADISLQKPASGGICVLQNIESFDTRHNFTSLPHPLPLLPENIPSTSRTESQKSLRTLTLGSKQTRMDRHSSTRTALRAATNSQDVDVLSTPIVQAYRYFERQGPQNPRNEKVSVSDARKVRWILIYGTLQYLASALRAPKEVRDTESPNYPLCCLVAEISTREAGIKVFTSPVTRSMNVSEAIDDHSSASADTSGTNMAIQPDCQTHNYFAHTYTDTIASSMSPVEVPAPSKLSFRRLSRTSSRRSSVQLKSMPHCEILVYGYGNGLNENIVAKASRPLSESHPISAPHMEPLPRSASLSTSSFLRTRTPQLQLDCNLVPDAWLAPKVSSNNMHELASTEASQPPSSSGSNASGNNPAWSEVASTDSSNSSTYSQGADDLFIPPLVVRKRTNSLGSFAPIGTTGLQMTAPSLPAFCPSSQPLQGGFHSNFDTPGSMSAKPHHRRPLSVDTELANGLGTKMRTPPHKASMSVDHLPIYPKNRHGRSMSIDTDSFSSPSPEAIRVISNESLRVVAAVEAMSPLRSSPPLSRIASKKDNMMDIYSALKLGPEEIEPEALVTRPWTARSETSQSILDAIPPPISKQRVLSRRASNVQTMCYGDLISVQGRGGAVVPVRDEEKKSQVSKRRSFGNFWRR